MEDKNLHYLVSLSEDKCNASLLENNRLKPHLRRNIHYIIVTNIRWVDLKEMYDIEVPISDVKYLTISFLNTEKQITVYSIEKVFDIITSLFVNKMLTITNFNSLFVVREGIRIIDPMSNFLIFQNKNVNLKVEKRRNVSIEKEVLSSIQLEDDKIFSNLLKKESSQNICESIVISDKQLPTEKGICNGLANIGNTCFLNSSVQCLNACTGFINDITNYSVLSENNVLNIFKALIRELNTKDGNPETRALKNYIGRVNSIFLGYEEQDSIEFTECLLNTLHEVFTKEKDFSKIANYNQENSSFDCGELSNFSDETRGNYTRNSNIINTGIIEKEYNAEYTTDEHSIGFIDNENIDFLPLKIFQYLQGKHNDFILKNNSPVARNFYGQLTTSRKCKNCNFKSYKHDPITILPLTIPNQPLFNSKIFLILQEGYPIKLNVLMSFNVDMLLNKVQKIFSTNKLKIIYKNSELSPSFPVKNIKQQAYIFEYNENKEYYYCSVKLRKYLFLWDDFPFDFLIEKNDYKKLLFAKLSPFIKFKEENISFYFETKRMGFDVLKCYINKVANIDKLCLFFKREAKITVYDCLEKTMEEEIILKRCDNCKLNYQHKASYMMSVLPKYFVLQLKRFIYTGHSTKINTFVDFDNYITINDTKYKLKAVNNHTELGFDRGHYTAFVNKGEWIGCNDEVITKSKKIDKRDAYALYYEKI